MLKRQRPSGPQQQVAARPQVVQQLVARPQAPEPLARLVLVQQVQLAPAQVRARWVLAPQLVQVLVRPAQAFSARAPVLVVARWLELAQQRPTRPWRHTVAACWPLKARPCQAQ